MTKDDRMVGIRDACILRGGSTDGRRNEPASRFAQVTDDGLDLAGQEGVPAGLVL